MLVCDHAFVDNSGKLNLIGIFENVNLESIPKQLLKMVIVGSYLVSDPEANELKFEINILKPDNSKLAHLENERVKIGNNRKFNIIFEIANIRFDSFGEYKIEAITNGIKIGEQKINVKKITN